jgi:hypothetical protein
MERHTEKPQDHRFLGQIEADLVLVDRDLAQIEIKIKDLSDNYYRALGKPSVDQINQEYQFYQERKLGLLREKETLDKELEDKKLEILNSNQSKDAAH